MPVGEHVASIENERPRSDPDVIDAAFTAGTPNNDGIARSRSTNCGLKNLCQFVLGAMLITD
jgi:hypothetical protein